jgi:hypothetical protein
MIWKRSRFQISRRATTRGRTAGNCVLKNNVCINISSIKRVFSNQSHYFPDIHCIGRII